MNISKRNTMTSIPLILTKTSFQTCFLTHNIPPYFQLPGQAFISTTVPSLKTPKISELFFPILYIHIAISEVQTKKIILMSFLT